MATNQDGTNDSRKRTGINKISDRSLGLFSFRPVFEKKGRVSRETLAEKAGGLKKGPLGPDGENPVFQNMVEDFKGLLSKEAEDSSDEPSSDESGSDQEVDVPREEVTQLGTLMVDKSDEPANREGTHVRCSAKSCMHNMEGHCAKEEIKLRFNGQTVECENFQPTSPTKGVKDPPPSYDDE